MNGVQTARSTNGRNGAGRWRGDSPLTPFFRRNGDKKSGGDRLRSAQTATRQEVAESDSPDAAGECHHLGRLGGETAGGSQSVLEQRLAEMAAELGSPYPVKLATPGVTEDPQQTADVKPPRNKRGLALSREEIIEVYVHLARGLSLRQAAAEINRSHSTLVKLAKRDPTFAERVREYRELASSGPLARIELASQKSWRAAAWLVKYLDARERRGKRI